MWTITRAERVTGLRVELSYHFPECVAIGYLDTGEPYAAGAGLITSRALEALVYQNLLIVRQKVCAAQRWKCADCGKVKPLHYHHNIHRSKGRDDREENCVMICTECHERRHGR